MFFPDCPRETTALQVDFFLDSGNKTKLLIDENNVAKEVLK